MDTDRSVELATATFVALLVTRYGREAAARYFERLAAHVKTAGKVAPPGRRCRRKPS